MQSPATRPLTFSANLLGGSPSHNGEVHEGASDDAMLKELIWGFSEGLSGAVYIRAAVPPCANPPCLCAALPGVNVGLANLMHPSLKLHDHGLNDFGCGVGILP